MFKEEEPMADDAERLLRHIVRRTLLPISTVEVELDARAVEDASEIAADQERIVREEENRVADLADAFREGLRRAGAAHRAGGNAISLDDRRPEDDRQADALIHFLVRSQLATSTTRETDPQQYIYTISIDWPALERMASEARVDLGTLATEHE